MKSFFAPLRASLGRCAALLAIAAAVAFSVQRFADGAARERALEVDRHGALEGRLRWGPVEIGHAESGNAIYKELVARGIIGPEHRADWTEQVLRVKEDRGVAEVEFDLGPLQPVTDDVPRLRRYEIVASVMSLRIGALHEQQLLDFLDDLGKSVSSILRVRACRIERLADPDGPADARLKAQCAVDWITLRERT